MAAGAAALAAQSKAGVTLPELPGYCNGKRAKKLDQKRQVAEKTETNYTN